MIKKVQNIANTENKKRLFESLDSGIVKTIEWYLNKYNIKGKRS